VLKAIDDQPVWAVVCLFVAKPFRRGGVSVALLKGTIEYVRMQGGRILEAYPNLIEDDVPQTDVYMGDAHVFADLGFVEVARPRPDRVIMRYTISADSAT
jgi:GNAT superfamily N-acetyltransferase